MSDIYDQHSAAFSQVSAFVILKDGAKVATVAIKFPKDGAGRLYAYVHWIGTRMTRGHASGYGYDKRSAAVANAVRSVAVVKSEADWEAYGTFAAALIGDDGNDWTVRLEKEGFTVLQAV